MKKILFLLFILIPDYFYSQVDTITIIFGGDCTLAYHFENFVRDDFKYPFKNLDILRNADISMINLENPISIKGTKIEKEFNFRMHPKYLNSLLDGGIDIVSLANNHVYDYGEEALFDTMKYLDSCDIKYVGIGKDLTDARKPVIFTVKNKKIAFLSYSGSSFAANYKKSGSAPRNKKIIYEDLKKLKGIVDYIIINYHWGEEKEEYPNEYQKDLAHFTIDSGADLVIGHHPHVLQGIERYKNGVIVYSLGNFIFGGNNRRKYETILFEVKIINSKILYNVIPLIITNWQALIPDDNQKNIIINKVKQLSSIFKESIFSKN